MTGNGTGVNYTIPAPASQQCTNTPCTVTVAVNGAAHAPGDWVLLPPGTNNISYTITDANANVDVDDTTVTLDVVSPPSITAPAQASLNASDPTGVAYVIQSAAAQTCSAPPCTVSVLVGGTLYSVGNTVLLSGGSNTSLTYLITDSKGAVAQDVTSVAVAR
jgi:hypothetical protein